MKSSRARKKRAKNTVLRVIHSRGQEWAESGQEADLVGLAAALRGVLCWPLQVILLLLLASRLLVQVKRCSYLQAGLRIRIRIPIGSGSGSRRAKMTHKSKKKISNFRGCGSAFIWYGSGYSIFGWIPIRIQGFNDEKLKKIHRWKKKKFWIKNYNLPP